MPHKPGHTFRFVESKKPYNGRVLKVGDQYYSTKSGGRERSSKLLEEVNNVVRQNVLADKITPFVVGAKVGEDFYHPIFSKQVYYFANGNQISNQTKLHHHTIIPAGRLSNFMTQHTMDGNENDVFLTKGRLATSRTNRPSMSSNGTRRTQTRQTTQSPRRRTQTPRRTSSGGMGGRRNSGGGRGY